MIYDFQIVKTDMIDVPLDEAMEEGKRNIPPDIRPKMASYRMEVIFWGVRDIKTVHFLPVYKPRILIECCGIVVKSQVMENAKEFNNFKDPRIIVNLVINFTNIFLLAINCNLDFYYFFFYNIISLYH